MLTESIVGIDNGKAAGVPTDLSVLCVPIPKSLSNKEVVVFDFSSEWGWWNIEKGITSVEVMEIPGDLISSNFPRWVFSVGVEWMLHISPCIIKSLN